MPYKEFKPKKRVILVWFYEKAMFFSLLMLFIFTFLLTLVAFSNVNVVEFYRPFLFAFFVAFNFTLFLVLIYEWLQKKYFVLPINVYVRQGKKIKKISIVDIKEIKITQNKLERLLKIGKVRIKTQEGEIILEGVHYPEKLEIDLLKKAHALRKERI